MQLEYDIVLILISYRLILNLTLKCFYFVGMLIKLDDYRDGLSGGVVLGLSSSWSAGGGRRARGSVLVRGWRTVLVRGRSVRLPGWEHQEGSVGLPARRGIRSFAGHHPEKGYSEKNANLERKMQSTTILAKSIIRFLNMKWEVRLK